MSETTHVLFIDDELEWHDQIRTSLADYQIHVECVRELDAAVDKLGSDVFPIVLVDRRFGQDRDRGLEIIAELKRKFPEKECILLTSYYDTPSSIAALQREAYSAVRKGDLPTLLTEIRNAKFKQSLRNTGLDRGILQPLIGSVELSQFCRDLTQLDDPTDAFLDAMLTAFALSTFQTLNRDTLAKLVKGSSLAERIPSLMTLDDQSIEQLGDLSQTVIERAKRERLVRVASLPDSALAANEGALINVLLSGMETPVIDSVRLAWLGNLLRKDHGLFPIVARTGVQCLLGTYQQEQLRHLNMPLLIEFRAGKYLPDIQRLVDLLQRHEQIDPYRSELELLATLLTAHERYSTLCEMADFPLDAQDWLEIFCNELVPLMADARRLFAHQTAYPILRNTIEKCRIVMARFNARFVEFIWNTEDGYRDWSKCNVGDKGFLRTPDIIAQELAPCLKTFKRVLFIIFDGMSYLSWLRIRRQLTDSLFVIDSERAAYAVIPTATRFARSAIFAGQFPREFMSAAFHGNYDERRLLNEAMKRLGVSIQVAESEFLKYEERHERGAIQKQEKELSSSFALLWGQNGEIDLGEKSGLRTG